MAACGVSTQIKLASTDPAGGQWHPPAPRQSADGCSVNVVHCGANVYSTNITLKPAGQRPGSNKSKILFITSCRYRHE